MAKYRHPFVAQTTVLHFDKEISTSAGMMWIGAAILALALALHAPPAFSIDPNVYSPQVVKSEWEFEYAGARTLDSDKSKNDVQENQFSVGYGVTDYWWTEFYYAEFERGPGQPQDFTANEFENVFQFWPTGKYWLDAGLLVSYHLAAKRDTADSLEAKLLLQKDIGRFTTLVNLGGERGIGGQSVPGNDLASAINTRYRWSQYFEPGIEFQSDYGTWGDHASFNKQAHYLGPILYGKLLPGLKYEVGYLAGISTASADSAVRAKLEYEIYF